MTFAPFRVHGYRCRNKPDSKSRSVRVKKEGALWKSASARRDRASGLGRYLSVESASCGLECRAQEPIKTCRLELTETRTWVSSVSLYHLLQFLKIIYIYIYNFIFLLLSSFITMHHNGAYVSLPIETWVDSNL